MELPKQLVLYDGECGLCQAGVQWLLDHDPEGVYSLAPLQGETAARALANLHVPAGLDSMVLVEEGRISWESTAGLRVLRGLGWPWRGLAVFLLVPALLRDPVYRWIAERRHRWFARPEACRLPRPGEAARFLP